MMILKCEDCNVELIFGKTLSIKPQDGSMIIKNISFCPKCKAKYFWSDKFPNSEIEILEIEKNTIDN